MIAADSAEMQFGRHSHVLGTFVPDSTYPLMQMSWMQLIAEAAGRYGENCLANTLK